MQIMFDALDYNMNAQNAVEAPRFQTRHLVSSFDNHAWNIGDLMLDVQDGHFDFPYVFVDDHLLPHLGTNGSIPGDPLPHSGTNGSIPGNR